MALTTPTYASLSKAMTWPEHILKRGDLELSLVPLIGGRLMDVRFKGASLLFQNPDLVGMVPKLDQLTELPSRASHFSFPLWGGEKTWLAPDSEWPGGTPHPVLDSGCYELAIHSENAVSMTSPVCPQSGMLITRNIKLNDHRHWTISHTVTNKGPLKKTVGLWSVLMTRAPASYLFRPTDAASPHTVFGDPHDAYACIDGIGQISCDTRHEFKVGAQPNSGFTAARIPSEQGIVWIATTGRIEANTNNYAHGHALEFYNSGHYEYGELEWHSAAIALAPENNLEFVLQYYLVPESGSKSANEMFELIEKRCGVEQ